MFAPPNQMVNALMGQQPMQQPNPVANPMMGAPAAQAGPMVNPMPVNPDTVPGALGIQGSSMYGSMFGAPPMNAAPTSPY
jgi:hypothetical protein